MLVLTRLENQSVELDLGDGRIVRLVIVRVRHSTSSRSRSVRIGIDAPKSVRVHRPQCPKGAAA